MDKKHNLGRDAVSLSTSKIIVNIIAMVSAMLLARIRTLEENGIYSQLMLIITMASSIAMLGLPNSINYFFAKTKTSKEKGHFLSVFYSSITTISILLGIVLVALLPVWIRFFSNDKLESYGFFLLLFPLCQVISSTVDNFLIVAEQVKVLLWYRITNSISILAIIALIWFTKSTFKTYMILYLSVNLFFTILVFFFANKYSSGLKLLFDKGLIKSILVYSIPIGLASVVGTLNIELDKLLIGHYLNTEQLAIYTNASKEMPVAIIASSLTAVLMPKMVRLFDEGNKPKAIELWKTATSISLAIIVYLAIGMAFFSKEAIVFLYSDKYIEGAPIFAIYSIGLILKCTYFGMILNITGNTKLIFYSSVGSLLLNVILNYLLLHFLGWIGPAVGTLLSSITMNGFQLFYSCRILNVKMKDIFPWRECAILVLLNLLLGIMFYLLHMTLCPGVLTAIIMACLWGGVYFLVLIKWLYDKWKELNA